jgi:hypothetical protein
MGCIPPNQGTNNLPEIVTQNESVRTIRVSLRTLNVASSGLPAPAMVEIDAQGLDLKVLAGASERFGKTENFFAEASIGQADFANTALAVMEKMSEAGYGLIDIADMNRSPSHGVLWLCEFVFLETASTLLDSAVRYWMPPSASRVTLPTSRHHRLHHRRRPSRRHFRHRWNQARTTQMKLRW